jgi:hypothetical protein
MTTLSRIQVAGLGRTIIRFANLAAQVTHRRGSRAV